MKKAPQIEVSPPSKRPEDFEIHSPQASSEGSMSIDGPAETPQKQNSRGAMELSPFQVPLYSKSPLLDRSSPIESGGLVLTTHADDGFTLKSRQKQSFTPLTPVKKSTSKIRHRFYRKSELTQDASQYEVFHKVMSARHAFILTPNQN